MNPPIIEAVEPSAEDAAEAVFTGTAIYVTNGQRILNLPSGIFGPSTRVTVSIVEVDGNNVPFIGSARMTVHNVRPYRGGVHTWVNIEWSSPIRIRASFFWEN